VAANIVMILAFCTMGTGSFPAVKQQGRGADHTPTPSTEVEYEYSCNSTPPLGPCGLLQGDLYLYIVITVSRGVKQCSLVITSGSDNHAASNSSMKIFFKCDTCLPNNTALCPITL
jgi:hypothetical protein